ncbi:MAG: signal peptidase I [Patescibacteria group bacterium]
MRQTMDLMPKTIGTVQPAPRRVGRKEEIRETLAEVIKVFILAAAVILPIRMFLIQPFYVKGASMEPNFYENEYLIIDKISPRFREYERGEPIVFRYPPSEHKYLIKRVIGLPDERVIIHNRRISIMNAEHPNGFPLNEDEYNPYLLRDEEVDVQLTADEYYVLGDNRPLSFDSEIFGPIKEKNITGRVFFRGWPLERIEVFEAPTY